MAISQAPSGPMRLLLIDDDGEYAAGVLASFQPTQLMCRHCTTSQFQPEMIKNLGLHMVLLHLGMLEMGSAALCSQVRTHSRVPITILSQRTRREDLFHFLNLGADDFIAMRQYDSSLMMVHVLALLRRVYEYDRPPAKALHPQPVRSQIPNEWPTCESCSYMGPPHRFEKTDAAGARIMSCPNCNRTQNLRFKVG